VEGILPGNAAVASNLRKSNLPKLPQRYETQLDAVILN
jgi:hypothetical protein